MNKKQTERIATIALAAFLIGYFCYQVAYGAEVDCGSFKGWNVTTTGPCSYTKFSHSEFAKLNNNARIENGIIANGTFNIVNSTDGTSGTISFDSGKGLPRFVQNFYGIHHGTWDIAWFSGKLSLGYDVYSWHCCFAKSIELTFKSPNHIELTDQRGGTIHLMR
jgi:hypothetical protein